MKTMQNNTNNSNTIEKFAAETAAAIKNIVNATIQNQNTVQNFTTTNTVITQNMMLDNQQLAGALKAIATLQGNNGVGGYGQEGKEQQEEEAVDTRQTNDQLQ